MHTRVQIASIAAAVVILIFVFELVRRRKLSERYALLWMAASVALLVLAVWQGLLYTAARAMGIYYPPNAFFVIAFGFALLLLLHFSITVSQLTQQTRVLAQRVALLEAQSRAAAHAPLAGDDAGSGPYLDATSQRGAVIAHESVAIQ